MKPTVRGEAFFAKLAEFRLLLQQSGRNPGGFLIGTYYEPAISTRIAGR